MKRYIRTNDDGDKVLDYDLLDIGARANFLNDLDAWATNMNVMIDFDDPDFSDAEKAASIESHVNVELDHLNLYDADGEEATIEEGTRAWMQEILEGDLSERYLGEQATPVWKEATNERGEAIIINPHGEELDYEAAVNLMDDNLREELHMNGPHGGDWKNEAEFFAAYAKAHRERFGEEWELAKSNPTW